MRQICGREKEIELLHKMLRSNEAQFLAIYGRRRVGKTYLIENFFQDKGSFFHFTGIKGATLKEHLLLFKKDIAKQLIVNEKVPTFRCWLEAFLYLGDVLENLDRSKKTILFFDEIPWISTRKSGFLKALEYFWNHIFSKNPNAILVVCGSAASWMIEKIVGNKGGLYNRLTAQIRLEPFSLKEVENYLEYKNIYLDKKQIIDLYMVIGGVAKYLNYIEKGLSVPQNIQNICFRSGAPLLQEYNNLFSSLFDNHEDHKLIIEMLATKRTGLTYSELLKATGKKSGGFFSLILTELKEAGFIDFIPSFNKKKKEGKYYLIDEYSFFYLTWLKDFSESGLQQLSKEYWISIYGRAQYAAWSGFAFETLCRKNIKQIVKALKLEVVATQAVDWNEKGLQIDLIIDRRDNCMNLCEIKYYNQELAFLPEDSKKILFRRERFREKTKTKKTLFNTLISIYNAKKNASFLEAFDNAITLEDFFI